MITKLAYRYFVSKDKDKVLSLISWFSLLGVALGVAALIVVMGIMRGVRTELLDNIIGLNSHIIVSDFEDVEVEKKSHEINKYKLKKSIDLSELSFIKNYMLISNNEALLSAKNKKTGIIVKGIELEDLKRKFRDKLVCKNLDNDSDDFSSSIAVGQAMLANFNLKLGDKLDLISASSNKSILGSIPKSKTFNIDCYFNSGTYEYDSRLVFIDLDMSHKLFEKNLNLEIYVDDPENSTNFLKIIKNKLKTTNISDWKMDNAPMIRALEIEKISMFSILFLLIVISGFNIISSITILVKDKMKDIAILKTIGFSNFNIISIFFIHGLFIATFGIILGILLGLLIGNNLENIRIFLENLTQTKLFDPVIYFLYHLPCKISYLDVAVISLSSFILCVIACIYPSYKASSIKIIDIIRN